MNSTFMLNTYTYACTLYFHSGLVHIMTCIYTSDGEVEGSHLTLWLRYHSDLVSAVPGSCTLIGCQRGGGRHPHLVGLLTGVVYRCVKCVNVWGEIYSKEN